MPIDGVAPSVQTVQGKTYPYARPTFYYTNGEPTGLAKEFLNFTIGAAGQKIVAQVGFVPIK
jgi:phosphate transport system substrate-binding protein